MAFWVVEKIVETTSQSVDKMHPKSFDQMSKPLKLCFIEHLDTFPTGNKDIVTIHATDCYINTSYNQRQCIFFFSYLGYECWDYNRKSRLPNEFEYKNVIENRIRPLRTLYLSNEIKKDTKIT
jgi:hypothetical protein